MPIYEYRCPSCDIRFEVKRGFSESTGATCPRCECQAQRIFSPVPIVFKGPGFYVTDHASDSRNACGGGRRDEDSPAEKTAGPEAGAARAKDGEKPSGAEAADSKPAEVKA